MIRKLTLVLYLLFMLRLVSLNACGLRTAIKITGVLAGGKGKIMCLQETRWDEKIVREVQKQWRGKIFTCNVTNSVRGVAVLVPEEFGEKSKMIGKDTEGRLIIVEIEYKGEVYRIINVHCPNCRVCSVLGINHNTSSFRTLSVFSENVVTRYRKHC
uniref:Uncharacterized protein n=1 Tax=Stegastes partitus TaxID=144197 RepID=A0A3B4ZZ53_9TELE